MSTRPKISYTDVSTEQDVIDSIRTNGLDDVLGGQDETGQWWADSISLREWRERQKQPATE